MEERLHGMRPTGSGAALAVARGTQDPEGQEAKRRSPAEVLAVLAVESVRVPRGVVGGRVTLAARRSTAALATPVHRVAVACEPEPMAEDTTTQHQASRSPVGATTGTGGAA